MNAAQVVENLKQRFPNEPEYIQAVSQVLPTIEEEYNKHPEFEKANLIERLCIPDRVIEFRVTWVDDQGKVQKYGLSYSAQQRYRPVQRRYPLPQERKPWYPEVPCFRADFQELSDNTSYGWC